MSDHQAVSIPNETSILRRFVVADRPKLASYLEEHAQVLPILLEAADQLNSRFPQSELELKVVRFPEAGNYQQLFVYVKTDLPVEEASARLDAFDDEWFLEADTRGDHGFNVKLRFA